MGSKGKFGKWVIITLEAYWGGVANLAHNLYARAGLADSEAVTAEYLLITYGMEFRKACAELKLVTIYVEGAVGSLLSLNGILRKTVCIYGEEITHAGTLEFQITGNAVKTHNVNYVLLNRAEYPLVREDKRKSRQITCKPLAEKLFALMDWEAVYSYRFQGMKIDYDGEIYYMFDLSGSEPYLPRRRDPETGKVIPSQTIVREDWKDSFGMNFAEHEASQKIDLMQGYVTAAVTEDAPIVTAEIK